MPNRLNLARRPFVDLRVANAVAAVAVLVAVTLTFFAVATVRRYYADSKKTREEIAVLRAEIDRLEASEKASEAVMSRYDLRRLALSASEVNDIARQRSFSWTRFLTRLEKTLPGELRVESIGLGRIESAPAGSKRGIAPGEEGMEVSLSLFSSHPEGLQKGLKAFYSSPYFDHPVPLSEENPEKAQGDAWHINLRVTYRDVGTLR